MQSISCHRLTLIIVLAILCYPNASSFAANLKECFLKYMGGELDGLPMYRGQRLLRPKDPSLYLTKVELERRVTCSSMEDGPLDYSLVGMASTSGGSSWLGQENEGKRASSSNSHPTAATSLMCSATPSSIVSSSDMVNLYFDRTTLFSKHSFKNKNVDTAAVTADILQKVLQYNSSQSDPLKKIRVLSYSMGCQEFMDERVLNAMGAIADEVTIVMAAGNHSEQATCQKRGQSAEGIIQVEGGDIGYADPGPYSFGPHIKMSAPTAQRVKSIYEKSFGATSAATPMVAGSLLTIHQVNPSLNAVTARAILYATAQDMGPSQRFGFGYPNIPLATRIARELKADGMTGFSEQAIIAKVKTRIAEIQAECTMNSLKQQHEAGPNCPPTTAFPSMQTTSAQYVESASNCGEFDRRFDALLTTYLLSGQERNIRSEMCSLYIGLDYPMGAYQACDLKTLRDKKPVLSISGTPALFGLLAEQGPDVLGAGLFADTVRQALKNDRSKAIRSILDNPKFQERNPALFKETLGAILSDPALNYVETGDVLFILAEDFSIKANEWPQWYSKLKTTYDVGSLATGVQTVLSNPLLIKLRPDLWKKEVTDNMAQSLRIEFYEQSWVERALEKSSWESAVEKMADASNSSLWFTLSSKKLLKEHPALWLRLWKKLEASGHQMGIDMVKEILGKEFKVPMDNK